MINETRENFNFKIVKCWTHKLYWNSQVYIVTVFGFCSVGIRFGFDLDLTDSWKCIWQILCYYVVLWTELCEYILPITIKIYQLQNVQCSSLIKSLNLVEWSTEYLSNAPNLFPRAARSMYDLLVFKVSFEYKLPFYILILLRESRDRCSQRGLQAVKIRRCNLKRFEQCRIDSKQWLMMMDY